MPLYPPLTCYKQRDAALDTYCVRDARGHQYIVTGSTVRRGAYSGPSYYGRINFRPNAGWRAANMSRLRNEFNRNPHRKRSARRVFYSAILRRTTQVMNGATKAMFGEAKTATQYARGCGYAGGAPFEWCHLAAHGYGGPDSLENIVAGTANCNSEQLIIENALWQYRNEELFEVHISSTVLHPVGAPHLGGVIRYRIYAGGQKIFTHYIDCFSHSRPDGVYEDSLFYEVVASLNEALAELCPHRDRRDAAEAIKAVERYVRREED